MKAIERTLRRSDRRRGHMRVARRRRQAVMAEQDLDDTNLDAALEQVGGEAVPQGVHADPLDKIGRFRRRPARRVQDLDVDRLVG